MEKSVVETRKRVRREWIPAWYRGWFHFGFTSAWCLGLMGWAFSRVESPSWAELAVAPVSFLFANAVEYLAHRFPMHHRWGAPGFGLLFDRHTVLHHAFFTNRSMQIESSRDFKAVLFPPGVAITFVVGVAGPIGLAFDRLLGSPNAGFIFFGTALAYFLTYEWLHWSYHQPWAAEMPGLRTLSRHHTEHHDPRLMTRRHFNITFPVFDRLFGTG